jgi:hypothetical protein
MIEHPMDFGAHNLPLLAYELRMMSIRNGFLGDAKDIGVKTGKRVFVSKL